MATEEEALQILFGIVKKQVVTIDKLIAAGTQLTDMVEQMKIEIDALKILPTARSVEVNLSQD